MIDITKLNIGDKVHYKAHENAKEENGIVKAISYHNDKEVWVVYHCNDDWDNFANYTSALTPIDKLNLGWSHEIEQAKIDAFYADEDLYDSAQYLK